MSIYTKVVNRFAKERRGRYQTWAAHYRDVSRVAGNPSAVWDPVWRLTEAAGYTTPISWMDSFKTKAALVKALRSGA